LRVVTAVADNAAGLTCHQQQAADFVFEGSISCPITGNSVDLAYMHWTTS